MIKVIYNKVCGRCVQSEPLTSGMVGQPIHFEYSHDFDGLAVTAVFTDGKNTVDVVNPGNECIIPHEVLTTVGAMVKVGIYAVKGDELVIPTIYAHIGVVLKGADPSGDVSIDPTLPIWAQTQALIGNLSQIETETKDSLVAAINEVKQTADRKANAADLAPVATSGSYSDLTDKPTIPSVPTATIAANTAARHTHDNKTLLDSITEALKTAWNTASEWVITNSANVLSHLADSVRHITATERSAWNGKQDKLIAGDNITIAADGKTISATGGGGGGSTVELDTTLSKVGKAADAKAVGDALAGKQDKLIAGENITIAADGKTISATGGGVQSDWNQNDSTAADYVKNRPFYTGDPVETVLVEESTVTFEDNGGMYMGQLESTFSATVGETYKVSWDGTTYECACVEDSGNIAIGNLSFVGAGPDTGEPFLMGVNNGPSIDIMAADTAPSHTFSISGIAAQVVKINEKYLPELPHMDKVNPTGTGAFSLNRKADTTIGNYSFAECHNTTASGYASHAEGTNTTASGYASHAEGADTTASSGASHAEGTNTTASGEASHAEGIDTTASGYASHAEGYGTKASSHYQHVHGKYNIEDTSDTYAEIVGNGATLENSNAYTLDWSGNAWYAGTVEGKALILPSSTTDSTKKFKITVDDSGALTATEIV